MRLRRSKNTSLNSCSDTSTIDNGMDSNYDPSQDVGPDSSEFNRRTACLPSDKTIFLNSDVLPMESEKPLQEAPDCSRLNLTCSSPPETNMPAPVNIVEEEQNSNNVNTSHIKGNFCCFCKGLKLIRKIARHLQQVHKTEQTVKDIANLPDNDTKKALDLLRRKGNFLYNQLLCRDNTDENIKPLKLMRQQGCLPSEEEVAACTYCYGLFLKQNLYKHSKYCPGRTQEKRKFSHLSRIDCNTFQSNEQSEMSSIGFRDIVLKCMKNDAIGKQVKDDVAIQLYGKRLFDKHKHLKHLVTYVSTKCRELARLVLAAKAKNPDVDTLSKLLVPHHWELFVSALKEAAKFNDNSNHFGTPSLALKISYSVKFVLSYLRIECIKSGDLAYDDVLGRFQLLVEKDLTERVSSKALNTLYVNKFNKPTAIPLAEDILKVYNLLKQKLQALTTALRENPTSCTTYDGLCRAVAAYILVFNRRRPGELSRLEQATYAQRQTGLQNDEITMSLTKSEQLLAKSLTIVEMRGKKGRKVPLLCNKISTEALDLMEVHRRKCGVPRQNIFLFALSNSETHVNLTACLRDVVNEADISKPGHLTSTKLRKHLATSCQILDLAENDMDQIAQFMGHDLHVHREFYRLPSAASQLARVSKIFTLMDRGELHCKKSQSLDTIQVSPDEGVDVDSSEDEDDDDPQKGQKKTRPPVQKRGKTKRSEQLSDTAASSQKRRKSAESGCNAKQKKARVQKRLTKESGSRKKIKEAFLNAKG